MRDVEIKIRVKLEDDKVKKIDWLSDDPPSNGESLESKAFLLSVFDKASLETMRIDLWTDKMQVGEMDRLFYFTLRGMSQSYFNATRNQKLSNDLARFAQYFGEETGIISKIQDKKN